MGSDPGYLIDTNILLRISRFGDPLHQVVKAALDELRRRDVALYFSLQNVAEFWNVCTRPTGRNGFGLTTLETSHLLEFVERSMTYLPDNEQVYSIWRKLVITHSVSGVQVHDARLVAVMLAHGITHLLTLNQPDFARYSNIHTVHPSQLQVSIP
jgi:predicted nucleic acid-binding protein